MKDVDAWSNCAIEVDFDSTARAIESAGINQSTSDIVNAHADVARF